MHPAIERLRGGLIVSCQAEGDDPFNKPEYIALFARAAEMGGAAGVRARDATNIRAIKAAVGLPVIGLTKGAYPDGSVLITPDLDDAAALVEAAADVLAVDATCRVRPSGLTGAQFVAAVKERRAVPVMADCATLDEALAAEAAGADMVGTTLSGYTPYSRPPAEDGPDWNLLSAMVARVAVPVIAEGHVSTPADAARAIALGAFAVVVGTVITRPRVMVGRYADAVRSATT